MRRSLAGLAIGAFAVSVTLTACVAGDASASCVTSVRLLNERAAVDVELTEASAQSQLNGSLIALFATDYPQEGLTGLGRQPELVPDGNLVWIDLGDPRGTAEPLQLQPGIVVELGAGEPHITASHWTVTRFDMLAAQARGVVEVQSIGESICVSVDLASDEFSVVGTISAPLEIAP